MSNGTLLTHYYECHFNEHLHFEATSYELHPVPLTHYHTNSQGNCIPIKTLVVPVRGLFAGRALE